MSSTERSDSIYHQYLSASEKFDYFVLGVSIALVGYLGSGIEPTALNMSSGGLEAIAAILFLTSAYAGFKRIEWHVQLLKVMHRRLYSEESAGAAAHVATSGRTAINTATGDIISPEAALDRYLWHRAGVNVTEEWLEKASTWASHWYNMRNGLLIAGLITLVSSRVLPIYLM